MNNSSKHSSAKTVRIFAALVLAVLFLAVAAPTLAQTDAPRLQVPIPGIDLTKAVRQDKTITVPFLAQYISGLYTFLISVVGVLAGVMMMIGGFQYLTAGGDKGKVDAGKEKITNAITGLVLALGSYVILYAINPRLVEFSALELAAVSTQTHVPVTEDQGDVDLSVSSGNYACKTIEECRALCAKPRESWPTTAPSVLDQKLVRIIPTLSNLKNARLVSGSDALINALTRANDFAVAENVVIKLSSAYRPLRDQIRIVCDDFIAKGRESEIGSAVAWPGGSNHGSGKAVDLWIEQGTKTLTTTSYAGQSDPDWKAGSILLDKIMTQAGFKRYAKEIWHFEINTSGSCRCQYPNCPFPPKC